MNAPMVKAGQVRRSQTGAGNLYPLPQAPRTAQQKPLFRVLENSALAHVTNSEQNGCLESGRRTVEVPITRISSIMTTKRIPFAFSFPLCDLLICEFLPESFHESACGNQESSACYENGISKTGLQSGIAQEAIALVHETSRPFNVHSLPSTLPSLGARPLAKKVSRVAQYILQKVVSRKPIGFQPNPKKVPNYILCYVEETLECGHVVKVYPGEGETLTARKRSCHECSGFFGGLKLSDLKKPAQKAWDETKRKMSGKGNGWAIPFAFATVAILVTAALHQQTKDFTYTAPADKFQILKRFDAFHYQFRWIHNGAAALDFPVVFCPNYEPQLSAGQTLTWLHYQDLGRCWDILPEGYGYDFETRDGLHPTLAPNCFVNDRDVTECKPNSMEARF